MTPTWSGGLAFSYFPAVGGYGMVNISSDGSSVTTSDDFTRLRNVLSNITFINQPTQSSASQSSYPSCPSAVCRLLLLFNKSDGSLGLELPGQLHSSPHPEPLDLRMRC